LGVIWDLHHWVPKSRGGKETGKLHRICHQKMHSVFSEKELEKKYNTSSMILSHEEIQKFVKWVRTKHVDFVDVNVETKQRKYKRKRK